MDTAETGERIPGLSDSVGDFSGDLRDSTFNMILLLFSTSRMLVFFRYFLVGELEES